MGRGAMKATVVILRGGGVGDVMGCEGNVIEL